MNLFQRRIASGILDVAAAIAISVGVQGIFSSESLVAMYLPVLLFCAAPLVNLRFPGEKVLGFRFVRADGGGLPNPIVRSLRMLAFFLYGFLSTLGLSLLNVFMTGGALVGVLKGLLFFILLAKPIYDLKKNHGAQSWWDALMGLECEIVESSAKSKYASDPLPMQNDDRSGTNRFDGIAHAPLPIHQRPALQVGKDVAAPETVQIDVPDEIINKIYAKISEEMQAGKVDAGLMLRVRAENPGIENCEVLYAKERARQYIEKYKESAQSRRQVELAARNAAIAVSAETSRKAREVEQENARLALKARTMELQEKSSFDHLKQFVEGVHDLSTANRSFHALTYGILSYFGFLMLLGMLLAMVANVLALDFNVGMMIFVTWGPIILACIAGKKHSERKKAMKVAGVKKANENIEHVREMARHGIPEAVEALELYSSVTGRK